ncbi:GntP family permease [Pontibacter diazotrophicus]|uniref:GntP family permease n=1 Tax=Pontibacter diazotrophicus TaxID=1400979 RepID=A0A3D8LCA5_9BACT|nr:gluconate:H+ symporter [Pontibacter diazotrophicus]RDV15069.1 GntP family permease [Pontibacter diazotrophicus]
MAVIYLLLCVALIIFLTARLQVHPFLALFLVAIFYGFVTGMPLDIIVQSINTGFGETLGKIGLIIIFGVIIGAFLENSGGAYALAEKVLRVVGQKRVTAAMGIIGYFVSIPVFADSGFLLVSPLNRSMAKKAGISLTGPAVALGLGLTATHTMVPPTPGPIAAAGILNADLGLVMLVGVPISALALIVGLLYATKYAAKTYIEPNPQTTEEEINLLLKDAPGPLKSSIPVLVPIILIVAKSLAQYFNQVLGPEAYSLISFLGEPVVALCIGAFLSLILPKKLKPEMLSSQGWIGNALRDAASVILITGAGGIFGKILQNSGIADTLGESLAGVHLNIWLPFLLAAAIKTAQGSSTVALITTASIVLPMITSLGFETELEKAMVVIAIGAGSAVVSHANDSFFWVVTQMSGMNVRTGYRLYTTGTLVIGLSAAFFLFLSYLLFT